MGGRLLPIDCDDCGGVIDWGDFAGEDPPSTPTCACPPVTIDGALGHLHRAARATATELEQARADLRLALQLLDAALSGDQFSVTDVNELFARYPDDERGDTE
jgi:hypothetical protein